MEEKQEEIVNEEIQEQEIDLIQEDELTKLQNEVNKLKNDYAKVFADSENLRKRLNKEAEEIRKYRIKSFALEIIPVIDNLERALANKSNDEQFYKGVEMIYGQLLNALKNEGVIEIDCLNKPFDSNYHQAIMQEEKDGIDANIVIEVLQKGYLLKDRILRAAMVKISK